MRDTSDYRKFYQNARKINIEKVDYIKFSIKKSKLSSNKYLDIQYCQKSKS